MVGRMQQVLRAQRRATRARLAADFDPSLPVRRPGRRKDAVRWCRGHEGHEHLLPEVTLNDFGTQPRQCVPVQCRRCKLWVQLVRKGQLYAEHGLCLPSALNGRMVEVPHNTYLYEGAPVLTYCRQPRPGAAAPTRTLSLPIAEDLSDRKMSWGLLGETG